MRKLFKERKLFKGGNYMRKYGKQKYLPKQQSLIQTIAMQKVLQPNGQQAHIFCTIIRYKFYANIHKDFCHIAQLHFGFSDLDTHIVKGHSIGLWCNKKYHKNSYLQTYDTSFHIYFKEGFQKCRKSNLKLRNKI